jgi:hypothetical protein
MLVDYRNARPGNTVMFHTIEDIPSGQSFHRNIGHEAVLHTSNHIALLRTGGYTKHKQGKRENEACLAHRLVFLGKYGLAAYPDRP